MNLKEEIDKVTEIGVSPANGITYKWVRPWDVEVIAETYAKEKVLEYAIFVAETINDCTLTPNENKNVEKDVNEWWEENK